jgi:hypothetical protein
VHVGLQVIVQGYVYVGFFNGSFLILTCFGTWALDVSNLLVSWASSEYVRFDTLYSLGYQSHGPVRYTYVG